MKTTRFAQESAAQAKAEAMDRTKPCCICGCLHDAGNERCEKCRAPRAEAQKPFKDINWAVREICKAYGHAPSCTGGTAELADILKELLESNKDKHVNDWLSQALNEGDGVYRP